MALTAEDIEQLAGLIETKVKDAVDKVKGDVQAAAEGATDVAESAPVQEAAKELEYYVHLADGSVKIMPASELDAAGTHIDGVAVIGKYQVGG